METAFDKTLDLLGTLQVTQANVVAVLQLVRWPMQVRGYGPVRAHAFERAMEEREMLEAKVRVDTDGSQKAA
jgi:hypothetical protein